MPPSSASDARSAVIRLHPIRSLVLASDAAYRDRVLQVVGDLGPVVFGIAAERDCGDPADILELVRRERADVVVLDASGCEAGAQVVIEAVAEAAPRVGVVVVCEHSTPAARRIGALPKWGWTQDLRNAVERAHADRRLRLTGALPAGRPRPAPRPAGPLSGWD